MMTLNVRIHRAEFSAHNNLVLSLSTTTMAEATRPKTRMEHIEEAIAKLDSNQLRVTTKLDELIQHITALEARQHNTPTPPSFSSTKTFLSHTPISTLSLTLPLSSPLKLTPSPMLTPSSMPTLPPHPAPLPILFLMLVPHLDTNSKHQVPHVREAASHDKLLEHRDMALFERGVVPYGSAMVARKRQPVAFALGTATDPKESRRYKPWDPGGPWWTCNTLRTSVYFVLGQNNFACSLIHKTNKPPNRYCYYKAYYEHLCMTRGNPSDLQPFDPEIDRTFHRLVRHHFIPFEHPEHSVTGESVHSVTFAILCNNLEQLNNLKLMLQTSTIDLLNLSRKISHNRTIMTSLATGTFPGGGIIPTLDGRVLHNNSNNNNNLIFKMLLAQVNHTFLHQSSNNNSNSPRNNKQLRPLRNLPLKNFSLVL
ncbi:hypothetical protein HKD37_20G056362 [Glycine soja]